MKLICFESLMSALIAVIVLHASQSQAAIWRCFADPQTCPGGDHIRCIGHGWCGPSCDVCRPGAGSGSGSGSGRAQGPVDEAMRNFSLTSTPSEISSESPFEVTESEYWSPWSDPSYCSRAEEKVEKRAAEICGDLRARRVSEFKTSMRDRGLFCTATAQFVCEGPF